MGKWQIIKEMGDPPGLRLPDLQKRYPAKSSGCSLPTASATLTSTQGPSLKYRINISTPNSGEIDEKSAGMRPRGDFSGEIDEKSAGMRPRSDFSGEIDEKSAGMRPRDDFSGEIGK